MIRKTIFWTHLAVGVVTGVVVFVLCVTGALLAFERPIIDWAERDARALPPAGTAELASPDLLRANAAKVEPKIGGSMEWFSDPRMPVRIARGNQSSILLNGYTGEVLGRGADSLRGFFVWITSLHVSLLMKLTGSQIVGVSNACFVILIFSGLYLWWPRQWRWKALRNSMAIRLELSGKARDWNWHNALGFWFLTPLFIMAVSGLVLSFKPVDTWWRSFAGSHVLAAPQRPAPPAVPVSSPTSAPSWNDLMRTVQNKYPSWRSIELGNSAPLARQSTVVLNVNLGQRGQRTQVYTVKVDQASNTILKTSGWAEEEAGNRARAIARLGHSGEILGYLGETLALLGCLAGGVLVYTGFALSWRRFFGRKSREMAVDSI